MVVRGAKWEEGEKVVGCTCSSKVKVKGGGKWLRKARGDEGRVES